jgi:hypothetical protein
LITHNIELHQSLLQQSAKNNSKIDFIYQNLSLRVLGSSNIHDWSLTGKEVQGTGKFERQSDGTLRVSSLAIKVPVTKMEASGGFMMDNNVRSMLEADTHPNIVFAVEDNVLNPSETKDTSSDSVGEANCVVSSCFK